MVATIRPPATETHTPAAATSTAVRAVLRFMFTSPLVMLHCNIDRSRRMARLDIMHADMPQTNDAGLQLCVDALIMSRSQRWASWLSSRRCQIIDSAMRGEAN